MALPTSYTEDELKSFMLDAVGNLAAVLALTVDSFSEAVNHTLLAYGVNDIADATAIQKLRALAQVEAWRVAVKAAAGRYNFQSANARYDRATIHKQALDGLADARWEAAAYVVYEANTVGITVMDYADNPYEPAEESDAEQDE